MWRGSQLDILCSRLSITWWVISERTLSSIWMTKESFEESTARAAGIIANLIWTMEQEELLIEQMPIVLSYLCISHTTALWPERMTLLFLFKGTLRTSKNWSKICAKGMEYSSFPLKSFASAVRNKIFKLDSFLIFAWVRPVIGSDFRFHSDRLVSFLCHCLN